MIRMEILANFINYSEKLSVIIACFLILSFAAGCAHVLDSPENSRTDKTAGPKSIKDVLLQDKKHANQW